MTAAGLSLDEEIRRALNAEPSPEFGARLRARLVAERDTRGGQTFGWPAVWAAGLMVATVLVIAVALAPLYRGEFAGRYPSPPTAPSPTPGTLGANAAPMQQPAPPFAESSPGGHIAAVPPDAPPAARVASAPRAHTSSEPEVLFDPREREGFRRLVAALEDGRLDPSQLTVDAPSASQPLEPIADLSVPPLPPIQAIDTGGY
jgi:hypothetical protein